MLCREEDAAIPTYCKDDERQSAQKMPPKAGSYYSLAVSGGYPEIITAQSPQKLLRALFVVRKEYAYEQMKAFAASR